MVEILRENIGWIDRTTDVAFTRKAFFGCNSAYNAMNQIFLCYFFKAGWMMQSVPRVVIPCLRRELKLGMGVPLPSVHTVSTRFMFSWNMHIHVSCGARIFTWRGRSEWKDDFPISTMG